MHQTWIKAPFKNWKNATEILCDHEQSQCHRNAIFTAEMANAADRHGNVLERQKNNHGSTSGHCLTSVYYLRLNRLGTGHFLGLCHCVVSLREFADSNNLLGAATHNIHNEDVSNMHNQNNYMQTIPSRETGNCGVVGISGRIMPCISDDPLWSKKERRTVFVYYDVGVHVCPHLPTTLIVRQSSIAARIECSVARDTRSTYPRLLYTT